MRFPVSFLRRAWVIGPLLAIGFVLWTADARSRRIDQVSALSEWSVDPPTADADSPTGYAGEVRHLVFHERSNDSLQWIAQTQQMLAHREWRIRHVDYDNAPDGRRVSLPSLYRWWLGLVAWCNHVVSGQTLGASVERAALWSEPSLHVLFILALASFVARYFGANSALLVSLGAVGLFPVGENFLSGNPDRSGLFLVCATAAVLPLAAAARLTGDAAQERRRRWLFAVGACAGAAGLWVDPGLGSLLILGIALGGMMAAALAQGLPPASPAPWRLWGLVGAAASLGAYMAEHYPDDLSFSPEANHPLLALSWLGLGELVAYTAGIRAAERDSRSRRLFATRVLLAVTLAVIPLTIALRDGPDWLTADPLAWRLTILGGDLTAENLAAWIGRPGLSVVVLAALLPALFVCVGAGWSLWREKNAAVRASIAIAAGPWLLVLPGACARLRGWSLLAALELVVLAAIALPSATRAVRPLGWWVWSLACLGTFALGLARLWPTFDSTEPPVLTETEAHLLVERDLAHWISRRAEAPARVLAAPDLTTSLFYYGNIHGLGTPFVENRAGTAAAVRIASATSPDETLELIRNRGITHVIVPSWDPFLDTYATMGTSRPEQSFVAALNRWDLPRWLRAVHYDLPQFNGLEPLQVRVFEVVDEQTEALAASRLAEYFVEAGQLEHLPEVETRLRRTPNDAGALTALAYIEAARGRAPEFKAIVNTLVALVNGGATRLLPWDRRLSLAIVLAQGQRLDLAREEIRRCVAQATEPRLRTLSSAALFRLLSLARTLHVEFPSATARQAAEDLLPPAIRRKLS